jgi:hypothetical protein
LINLLLTLEDGVIEMILKLFICEVNAATGEERREQRLRAVRTGERREERRKERTEEDRKKESGKDRAGEEIEDEEER